LNGVADAGATVGTVGVAAGTDVFVGVFDDVGVAVRTSEAVARTEA
jgi:hypothetical protein